MSVVPFIPADARKLFAKLEEAGSNRDAVVAAVVSTKATYGEGQVTRWVDAILRVRPDIVGLANFAGEARPKAEHPQLRTRNVVTFARPASDTPAAAIAPEPVVSAPVPPRAPGPLSYDQNRAVLMTDGHVHFTAMQKVFDATGDRVPTPEQVEEIGKHGAALRTVLQRLVGGADPKNMPFTAGQQAAEFLAHVSESNNPRTIAMENASQAAQAYIALCTGFNIRISGS